MQIFVLLVSLHCTLGAPARARAPNSTGTATQTCCRMVNRHTLLLCAQVSPGVITGFPQQVVTGVPTIANGVTLTGTQTVDF